MMTSSPANKIDASGSALERWDGLVVLRGDAVRFFGVPGVWTVAGFAATGRDGAHVWVEAWRAGEPEDARALPVRWLSSLVVEVNGETCPLLSLPIAPPASDWPHGATDVRPPESEAGYEWLRGRVSEDPRFRLIG